MPLFLLFFLLVFLGANCSVFKLLLLHFFLRQKTLVKNTLICLSLRESTKKTYIEEGGNNEWREGGKFL